MNVEFKDLSFWEKRLLDVIKDKEPQLYRKLVRSAGNLLRKNVRKATPRESGELRRSYRMKTRRNETTVYTNEFYANMVEEGHAIVQYERIRGSSGRVRRIKRELGFVPGKHYFRKGFEQTERELPALLKQFVRDMGKELGMDVSD